MLQDRESYVTLLVGAKYGISQIINNKLNIMTTLAEFSNISRIELTPESDKVSLVKVYLQDVKPLSLLLESSNAKDIACLISGYCKLFVDSGGTIFIWPGNSHVHRVSTEEGYESRACSDSEESSEVESSLEPSSDLHFVKSNSIKPLHEEEEEEEEEEDEEECVPGFDQERQKKDSGVSERGCCDGRNNDTDSISEASDSANTESHGYKISWSSDSIDALEEDDLETCSSSRPEFFQFYTPCLKETIPEDQVVFNDSQELENKGKAIDKPDPLLCFLQMSNGRGDVEIDRKPQRDSECREENELPTYSAACQCLENNVMEYYSLCTNVSPASSTDRNVPSSPESSCVKGTQAQIMEKVGHQGLNHEVETLILEPPPGFGDSSSEEEFFDAADRFTPTLISSGAVSEYSQQLTRFHYPDNATSYTLQDPNVLMQNAQCKKQKYSKKPTKVLRKRRSFLQTDYTSQVTFPLSPSISSESMDHVCCNEKESHLFVDSHSPTVSSLKDTEGEPALLETKPLTKNKQVVEIKSRTHSPNLIEMEPDTMETKSVTDSVISSISAIRFRSDFEVEEVGQSGKQCQYSVDADNSLEQNGQTSPSQISLQMDEISIKGQSDLCLAARDFDSGSSNSYMKEGNILENSETERKTTLNNIFKNGCQDEGVGVHISLNSSRDPNDRQSLYIAKSEDEQVPSLQSLSKSDNCEKVDNQNSPENSTFDKSCHFIHANDFLFDFMGFDDIFTNFPVVCSGLNGPYHEEKEHLLGNTDSDVPCSDSHNMIQCSTDGMDTIVSSSLNSLQTALDTFDLCYAENESRDFDDLELKSKKSSCEYSPHTQRFFWEAQLRTQNQADSTNKGLDRNKDATSVENGTHIPYSSEQKIPVNIKSPSMSKLGNAGNCSCQLSYTSCFHSVDTEIDHETMDFGETEPSLPRTIPPVSENILSNERSNIGSGNSITLELCEALNRVRNVIQESPTGFGKIQDSVLDLQKFLEGYKNKVELHPQDKCAAYFSEHKSSLCSVSRKLMSSTQKVLDSDHSSAEMYQAVAETFFDLMQMTEVCLQFSTCAKCSRQHTDIQSNLQDLLCTYHQFVQAAKKASEQENGDLHFKLLSRQCTSLTAAVFCLTQQYRTLICL